MNLFLAPIHPQSVGNRTMTSIPEWLKTYHPREVVESAVRGLALLYQQAPARTLGNGSRPMQAAERDLIPPPHHAAPRCLRPSARRLSWISKVSSMMEADCEKIATMGPVEILRISRFHTAAAE